MPTYTLWLFTTTSSKQLNLKDLVSLCQGIEEGKVGWKMLPGLMLSDGEGRRRALLWIPTAHKGTWLQIHCQEDAPFPREVHQELPGVKKPRSLCGCGWCELGKEAGGGENASVTL